MGTGEIIPKLPEGAVLDEPQEKAIPPLPEGATLDQKDDGHSDSWNKMQDEMSRQAAEAGLPPSTDGRQRILDAFDRLKKAGIEPQHFAGMPAEATGDRSATMDIDTIVEGLKTQESNSKSPEEKAALAKQRSYWENENKAHGMTAQEWKKQTGEDDPQYGVPDLPEGATLDKAPTIGERLSEYGHRFMRGVEEAPGQLLTAASSVNQAFDKLNATSNPELYNYRKQQTQAGIDFGKKMEATAQAMSPLDPRQQNDIIPSAMEGLGGMPKYMNPAAPLVMGSEGWQRAMDIADEKHLSDSERNKLGLEMAATDMGVGFILNKTKGLSDKFAGITEGAKATYAQAAKFIAAEAGQQIPLFAGQQVAHNAAEGEPLQKDVGRAVLTQSPFLAVHATRLLEGGEANPRLAEHANVTPESQTTLQTQQAELIAGKRPAMLFTPGETELPTPEGFKRVETPAGVFHFDPNEVTKKEIHQAVADDKIGKVLDYGIEAKPEDPSLAVVRRDAQGNEIEAVATDQQNKDNVIAKQQERQEPDQTVTVEDPAKLIEERQNETNNERTRETQPNQVPITEATPEELHEQNGKPSSPTEVRQDQSETPDSTGLSVAKISQERAAEGLDPIPETETKPMQESMDNALKKANKDPYAPERLLNSLMKKSRALDDEDVALLLIRKNQALEERSRATRDLDLAKTPEEMEEAQDRAKYAQEQLDALADVRKLGATKTGRGLKMLDALIDKSYTVDRMREELRADSPSKEIDAQVQKNIESWSKQIKELDNKISSIKAENESLKTRLDFNEALKEEKARPKTPKQVNRVQDFLDKQAEAARERIKNRFSRVSADITLGTGHLVDEAIIGASHIARGVTKFSEWSKKMVEEFGDRIKPHLDALFQRSKDMASQASISNKFMSPEERRLSINKKATIRSTERYKQLIEDKNFNPAKKAPVVPDKELIALRAEKQRIIDQFNTLKFQLREADRPWWQKAADTGVKFSRFAKISGIKTFAKVAANGPTEIADRISQEAVGGIIGQIPGFKEAIAQGAPQEGGFSAKAILKGLKAAVVEPIKNFKSIIKGERTNEEALYGKHNPAWQTKSVFDIPGRGHSALMNIPGEFARAVTKEKVSNFEARQGNDITSDAVKQRIGLAGEEQSQRAKFLNDNLISKRWNNLLRSLENDKNNPNAGYASAKGLGFLAPIVKIPSNVAIKLGRMNIGVATATSKLVQVMRRGVETATPAEKDFIMRHYKQGLVGAAIFFTGMFNYKNAGGFYQRGAKKDDDEPGFGEADILGVRMPKYLLAAPVWIQYQAGATAGKLLFGDKKEEAGDAALDVAKGMSENIIFLDTVSRLDQLLSKDKEGVYQRGSFIAGSAIPRPIQELAQVTDSEPKRYPGTTLEQLKMAIPGLRQQVPASLQEATLEKRIRELDNR